jgi:CHASE3 domain sensor protein
MRIFVITFFIVSLAIVISPVEIFADTALDVYMNDFYSKSNEASQILKEIENSLKDGSRKKVCSRQREAARLGLLANKSLIKAFEIEGTNPPMQVIKANQQRWESILNEC